jgi:hypothetical protein
VHRLRQRSAEDNYNTDWQEAWLGVDATDPLWKGLTGRALVRYVHTTCRAANFRLNVDDTLNNGVPDFQPEDATGTGEPSYLGVETSSSRTSSRKVAVGATAVLRAYDQQSNFAELDGLTASSLGAYVRWRTTAWTQLYLSYAYDTDYRYFNPDFRRPATRSACNSRSSFRIECGRPRLLPPAARRTTILRFDHHPPDGGRPAI